MHIEVTKFSKKSSDRFNSSINLSTNRIPVDYMKKSRSRSIIGLNDVTVNNPSTVERLASPRKLGLGAQLSPLLTAGEQTHQSGSAENTEEDMELSLPKININAKLDYVHFPELTSLEQFASDNAIKPNRNTKGPVPSGSITRLRR